MKNSNFFKIMGYMYQLHKRNFNLYFKPVPTPFGEDIRQDSIHWVGHATTVINLNGKILVTDPVTSNYLGQMKRLIKPSIDLSTLNIDYILLSHGHMDHLDVNTLKKLNKNTIVLVPKNFKYLLKFLGFKHVYAINPGETYSDNFLTIKAMKANHDGRRYMVGKPSECNSYLIESPSKSIFFAGDTAFTEGYKDIFADVAIMPVGCYKPVEYEKMHCNPEQAFKMFKMTNAKIMIPVHYKTYILAQDDDDETYNNLLKLNDGSMKILDVGQTLDI